MDLLQNYRFAIGETHFGGLSATPAGRCIDGSAGSLRRPVEMGFFNPDVSGRPLTPFKKMRFTKDQLKFYLLEVFSIEKERHKNRFNVLGRGLSESSRLLSERGGLSQQR